jgi:acyl dehydratase
MSARDPRRLLEARLPDVPLTVGADDAILYALAVGLGARAGDDRALAFLYEGHPRFRTLPFLGLVAADPGFWMEGTGLDAGRVVHLGERLEALAPIPLGRPLVRRSRVVHVADKGADRGALVVAEGVLEDREDGRPLARVLQTTLARGDGGFGGAAGEAPVPARLVPPDRPPDLVASRPTVAWQALLYRLTGDRNPLHADPAAARGAGFDAPPLHGLCTLGAAAGAVLEAALGFDDARMAAVEARFAAPVRPGQVLECALWTEAGAVAARVSADGAAVLDLRVPLSPQP